MQVLRLSSPSQYIKLTHITTLHIPPPPAPSKVSDDLFSGCACMHTQSYSLIKVSKTQKVFLMFVAYKETRQCIKREDLQQVDEHIQGQLGLSLRCFISDSY